MSNELKYYDRQKLEYWLRSKMSLRKIARIIRKDVSVISREIKRNSGSRKKYRADMAQRLADKRKFKQHKGKLDKYPKLKEYVEKKLLLDWSPEQISGRLKKRPPKELKGLNISYESIYLYIYERSEKHKKIYLHLRSRKRKRMKQGRRRSQKTAIPSRVSIHDRPEAVK